MAKLICIYLIHSLGGEFDYSFLWISDSMTEMGKSM